MAIRVTTEGICDMFVYIGHGSVAKNPNGHPSGRASDAILSIFEGCNIKNRILLTGMLSAGTRSSVPFRSPVYIIIYYNNIVLSNYINYNSMWHRRIQGDQKLSILEFQFNFSLFSRLLLF